jgi:hypothetical protein
VASILAIGLACSPAETPRAPQSERPARQAASATSAPSANVAPAASSKQDVEAGAAAEQPGPCEPTMFGGTPGAAGLFAFEDERGRWGFRDGDGRVKIPARFLHAYEFFPEGATGAVEDGGVFVFIDTTGRTIARAYPFDNGPDYFVEGFARIVENAKFGFIDRSGRIVVKPQYQFALSFCNGLAVVCARCWRNHSPDGLEFKGGKWGYVDTTGAVAIPLEYDEATPFFSDPNRAEVVKRGKPITIDRTGKPIPP